MSSPINFLVLLFLAMSMTGSAFTTPSRAAPPRRNGSSLSFAPTDFTDVGSLVLAKYDAKSLGLGAVKKIHIGGKFLNADVGAQILSDGSHALMDFPDLLNKKPSKLQMRYAQVIGRLMILGTGLLPHHGFHPEELAVQVFLLGVSMKPIIRSIQLYRCITSSSKCEEECELELYELEQSLP